MRGPKATIAATFVALACAPLAAPLAADTKTAPARPYVSVAGLYVMPNTSELKTTGEGYSATGDLRSENGRGFSIAAGYGGDIGLRGEIEAAYRKVDFKEWGTGLRIDYALGPDRSEHSLPYRGSATFWTVMANGAFAAAAGPVRPYVGGGLGVAFIKGRTRTATYVLIRPDGGPSIPHTFAAGDGDDTVLAYQGMVGVAYPLSERTEIRLGYRYFATGEVEINRTKGSFSSHDIEIGVRVAF